MRLGKSFIRCFLIVLVSFAVSAFAYAAPTEDALKDYYDTFKVTDEQLQEQVDNDALEDIHKFSELSFSQFFTKYVNATFASERIVSGEGKQGLQVSIYVYTLKEGQITPQKLHIASIGASGLFSYTVPYQTIGENHIFVAVKDGDTIVSKHFIINRKDPNSKVLIENINLKFYDGSFLLGDSDSKKESEDKLGSTLMK